jgi:hypothetical protein
MTTLAIPESLEVTGETARFVITILLPVAVAVGTSLIERLRRAQVDDRFRALLTVAFAGLVQLVDISTGDEAPYAVVSLASFRDWVYTTLIAVLAYLGFWKPVTSVNARAARAIARRPD